MNLRNFSIFKFATKLPKMPRDLGKKVRHLLLAIFGTKIPRLSLIFLNRVCILYDFLLFSKSDSYVQYSIITRGVNPGGGMGGTRPPPNF